MRILSLICIAVGIGFPVMGSLGLAWFGAGYGGMSYWAAFSILLKAFYPLGLPLVVLGIVAELGHRLQQKRPFLTSKKGKVLWLLSGVVLALLVTAGVVQVQLRVDEATRQSIEDKPHVTEQVKIPADVMVSFEKAGVIPQATVLGLPRTGAVTQVSDAFSYNHKIQNIKGLVGHPVDFHFPTFDKATISFQVTEKAGQVAISSLRICKIELDGSYTLLPDQTVDEQSRTLTAETDQKGIFGLIDEKAQ